MEKVKVIKKEEIEKREVQIKRTKIAMLKILLEETMPEKVGLIFPKQKVIDFSS
jgi:hypothetical protein